MRQLILTVCLSSFVLAAQANPVCDVGRVKAKEDLKQSLLARYGSSYATVKMLLDAGIKDYDTLCTVPENAVNNGILEDLKSRYYPSFSTILMLYKSNKKAYEELNR